MEACSCLRGLLKLFNFLLAFVGLALALFSIWHLCKFLDTYDLQRPHPRISTFQWSLPDAWFIYVLLGLGVFICLVSLTGHIAAETSNGCCLSSYIFFLILLALLEGAFVAEVFLNKKWEKIMPDDPTGLFDFIKEFVKGNLKFCEWAGLAIVIIEVLALLLALCTRAATPSAASVYYDSDDEYIISQRHLRQPLLIPSQTVGSLSTHGSHCMGTRLPSRNRGGVFSLPSPQLVSTQRCNASRENEELFPGQNYDSSSIVPIQVHQASQHRDRAARSVTSGFGQPSPNVHTVTANAGTVEGWPINR